MGDEPDQAQKAQWERERAQTVAQMQMKLWDAVHNPYRMYGIVGDDDINRPGMLGYFGEVLPGFRQANEAVAEGVTGVTRYVQQYATQYKVNVDYVEGSVPISTFYARSHFYMGSNEASTFLFLTKNLKMEGRVAQNNLGTRWMTFAESQMGQKEMNPGNNPNIINYHSTTGGFQNDETAWCSSFVNWSITQAGFKGTNSARALSWGGWGQTLSDPAYGSIAVIDYGGGKGHVGFVAGKNSAGRIILLGGNQSDMVKYSAFAATSISKFVYPLGYTPSYNLPTLNVGGNSSFRSTR